MKCKKLEIQSFNPVAFVSTLLLFIIAVVMAPSAMALTVLGVDNAGSVPTPLSGYRWLIEEDGTYHVPLNDDGTVQRDGVGTPVVDPNWQVGADGVTGTADDRDTVSVSFHQSYMPIVAKGTDGDDTIPLLCSIAVAGDLCLDDDKNYFISVLPAATDGYSIGGAQLKDGNATVFVNKNPIPTAQITIFVHEDIAPINNVWDLGEGGLAGFSIILEDAGGKYGASAGIQSQDAFGNPICTVYEHTDLEGGTTGVHDPGEPFVADDTGSPIIATGGAGAGCVTGSNGTVTVRNLAPGKYGILAVPPNAVPVEVLVNGAPTGAIEYKSTTWVQTSTIEGTKLIDAWVKANEPAFFGEFGPPGPHVSIGFVPAGPGPGEGLVDATVLTGGATISGQVVNLHLSAPPDTAFYNGGPFPHTTPWVGLNMGAAGLGKGIFAERANDDGTFSIPNVPPGNYQLVVWDDNLDLLFSKNTVVVNADPVTPPAIPVANGTCNAGTSCNLGDVPVFQWFARMEHYVFNDVNENGIWDAGELPMIEQNVNLRFRDGTIYQAFPTDGGGVAPFDQVFPFFSWLVAEVDFARFKATGATVTVDDGGTVPLGDSSASFDGVLSPQDQFTPADPACVDPLVCTETTQNRTEIGAVLTEAFQTFLGQTSVVEWGKTAYAPGENGGISGMVMYAVTRAEDDPESAAAEPWEPGIPRVTVNLFDSTGTTLLAITETDSWDDSLPTNCKSGANRTAFNFRGTETDCFDGMRVWNQVRPGVFDGGYAFTDICEAGLAEDGSCTAGAVVMPAGQYMVEVVPPYGYEVIKSQDRNVDFGDTFFPSPELLPPVCSGADYVVPAELSLFPGEPAPFAGLTMKTCDRKTVILADGANAAADFFLFTEVPIAGHFIGFILDDTANEFDPASPQFGEKYAPPFLPVSIRDWTGREISRTISDEYGVYNALIPSTFTENLGQPSGISPNMLTTCMNAKTLPNGTDDPLHNPQYSQFCYTFQYMPGSTTYLDTPVVPVAAFAGADQNPLDCEYIAGTPRIFSVDVPANGEGGGPYVPVNADGNIVAGGIVITSMGLRKVPNPAYDGVLAGAGGTLSKTIMRDYGFGDSGTVTLGGVSLTDVIWTDAEINATVPASVPAGANQLVVTKADGTSTITGVTVQVGLRPGASVTAVTEGTGAIQAAIDAAGTNDLILVGPGVYDELVIMWKPVQLQGWGEGSVTIDAIKTPFEKLADWRRLVEDLESRNVITRAPGQELGFGGIEPETFFSEEGAGVFVLARQAQNENCNGENRNTKIAFCHENNQGARIDGMSITGADTGGGVAVNAHADFLEISNLRVINNSAFFAGGVRVGHPMMTVQNGNNLTYSDANNNNVSIHHNTITQNGGLSGAGGGLALHTGSDGYAVTDNFVCGNFTNASGAGIAHFGLSDNGLIKNNTVLFNENFNQGVSVNGGGILVAGLPAFGCPRDPITGNQVQTCLEDPEQMLSPGSGSVEISANLIKGNSAGAGDGAGIRLSRINGQDVSVSKKGVVSSVYKVDVINNMIVDNVAALSGGGISIQDALEVNILHNTIANNDITSTTAEAFGPLDPTVNVQSVAQPGAGIIARAHVDLESFLPVAGGISNANMVDNIIWHNRQFFWMSDASVTPTNSGLCPDINGSASLTCAGGNAPVYDDLAVGAQLCIACILTGAADPDFVSEYVNGNRNTTTLILEGTTSMQAPPAFDEGGNFIRLRYGPLTQVDSSTGELFGDYHIQSTSSALDAGLDAGVTTDFDGDLRPAGVPDADGVASFDIGADEFQ